jgi:HD-like signal output (HDOD) protein
MSQAAAVSLSHEEALDQALRARIEGCRLELPLLPDVAAQVLALSGDARASAASLSALIHRDQALASLVLGVANSAAYAGNTPIVSLQHAIARLGLDLLASLMLAESVRGRLFAVPGFEEHVRGLWRHALLSGLFAKEIARARRANVETAFICGLLHGIGRPVALKAAVEVKRELRLEVGREAVLARVEPVQGQAGALLAVKWGLPQPVLESIVYCARGRGSPSYADEARTTLLASRLARRALEPEPAEEEPSELEVARELNLYPDDLEALAARGAELKRLAESMTP